MPIPLPQEVTELAPLAAALDAAEHAERLSWIYRLSGAEQRWLYRLAEGGAVHADELVGEGVTHHLGRNGLAVFNRFQKRFARSGDAVVGYNHNPGLIAPLVGPGHFTAVDSPAVPGEVWIDYRHLPAESHPDFPPLRDNERGIPALVFGNMVDVLRRVSAHVTIGNAYKDMPRDDVPGLLARLGSLLPTAPFVLCRQRP